MAILASGSEHNNNVRPVVVLRRLVFDLEKWLLSTEVVGEKWTLS